MDTVYYRDYTGIKRHTRTRAYWEDYTQDACDVSKLHKQSSAEYLPLKKPQHRNWSWRGEHFGVALYQSQEIRTHKKKKKKAVCVHVCVPCPALPSCLPPDLICIYELLENHVFVLRAKTVTTVLMSFFPFSSHWAGKKERKAEKNVEKRKQEGREWWKREGKASLMFPAKIFRLLPHDASPCPTDTRTLTHSHIYTQSKSRS